MASLSPDLDIALTQLTERLLTQDQTYVETYVMATHRVAPTPRPPQ